MKRLKIVLPLLLVGAWAGTAEAKADERKSIYPGKNWRCTSGVLGNRLSHKAHDGREREFAREMSEEWRTAMPKICWATDITLLALFGEVESGEISNVQDTNH